MVSPQGQIRNVALQELTPKWYAIHAQEGDLLDEVRRTFMILLLPLTDYKPCLDESSPRDFWVQALRQHCSDMQTNLRVGTLTELRVVVRPNRYI
jgi:hypothetical protein